MKSVILLLGQVAFASVSVVGVFAVATQLSASEPAQPPLPSVYAADLWTTEPTVVDPNSQHFERVAATEQKAAPVRAAMPVPSNQVASLDPAIGIGTTANAASASLTAEHAEWCATRYRSYNPVDNTYRSFSGQKRSCVSPFTDGTAQTAPASAANLSADIGVDVESCMRRYRSYNVKDNTYQPIDGGPRRVCQATR